MDLQNTYVARQEDLSAGITASAWLTTKIATTRNVHSIILDCDDGGTPLTEAQMKADLGAIEVRYNGVLIFDATATQLIDWQSYYLDKTQTITLAGQLVIPFTRMNLPVAGLNRQYALGMISPDGKEANLTVKVKCGSTVTNLDGLTVYYEYDLMEPEPLGLHVRLLSHTRTFSSTGTLDIVDLPIKGRQGVLAYHICDDTGTIHDIQVKHNNFDVLESVPYNLLNWRAHRAGRVPQTNYWHVDFALQNDYANGLPLGDKCHSLLLKPNWPSTGPGGSFTILEEAVCNGLQ